MGERIRQFMMGRYGADDLARCCLFLITIFLVLYMVTKSNVCYSLALVLLVINTFRIMSKNQEKRYQENVRFLNLVAKVKNLFLGKKRSGQDSTHKVYKCPNCKQKVRVPKGRGRIAITCPKCGTEFIKKT